MEIDLNSNPEGTWVREEDGKIIIGSTLRHSGMLSNLFFTICWTPTMFIFPYTLLCDTGEGILVSIVTLVFFLPGLWLWKHTLLSFLGSVKITLGQEEGTIYTGIKKLGRSKHFKYKDIHTIEQYVFVQENDVPKYAIRLINHEDKSIRFGGYMEDHRQDFIIETLRAFMIDGDKVRDTLEPDLMKHFIRLN